MRTVDKELRRSVSEVAVVARLALLVLCASLAAAKGSAGDLLWLSLLLPAAAVAALTQRSRLASLLALALESGVCGLAVLASDAEDSVFLPYLLAPAFSGGLLVGVAGAVIPPGSAALVLLAGRAVRQDTTPLREFSAEIALWVLLGAFSGLVTAWVSHLTMAAAQADPQGAQRAAYDLLSRLRTVARRLPGTLDPASTAEALLQSARQVAPFTEGAVLMRSTGTRLVPLTRVGAQRPEWDLALDGDGAIADAWATQEVQSQEHRVRRTDGTTTSGSSLVVPLVLGLRSLGLLVLESDQQSVWSAAAADLLVAQASDVALQLETGLLFDEVRALATTEERHRVAREIHDGIAQELVFLGYTLDNLLAEAPDLEARLVRERLRTLRIEVTRLVSELRLSLFDLRSEIDSTAGLGTVLSEHVRSVSTHTGLAVHLSLSEAAIRLPTGTEVELLRIAQEAVANVRKHAQATNLWVTCVVEPPHARLVIEDDGVGIRGQLTSGRLGLTIMRERAERIGAQLSVLPRETVGTRVEVRLGTVGRHVDASREAEWWEASGDADDSAARR